MSLSSLLNDPKHWQDRAAQAEALADNITDAVGRATALSIAEDYARLGAAPNSACWSGWTTSRPVTLLAASCRATSRLTKLQALASVHRRGGWLCQQPLWSSPRSSASLPI